jgi:hypothetical protein
MKKGRTRRLDFEIDKLTNSIENKLTGESVETEVVRLQQQDTPYFAEITMAIRLE